MGPQISTVKIRVTEWFLVPFHLFSTLQQTSDVLSDSMQFVLFVNTRHHTKLQVFPSTYTAGYVETCKFRQNQTQTAIVNFQQTEFRHIYCLASSSRNLIFAVSPTWRECSIKWDRCCRCCRSALGCLARWASLNAGTVKWVRDSSVLATCLAASLGRLRQRGLLKDGSVTAAGMPLLCPQRTGHGSHQHCSYTGSTVPPRSSNGLRIRGARSQFSYRCCHGLYYKCPAECLHMSLTFTTFFV